MATLEKRREKVLRLIELATSDKNSFKTIQGYYLLNQINERLSQVYNLQNRLSK